ncbi:hypothetical protein KCU92_g8924, partial [Aureobasidium melanogenum]|jgi:hypothetical protein
MQAWYRSIIVAIAALALFTTAHTTASSVTAISSDNTTYLAPLYESCPANSSTCGTIDGKYTVMLRKGYKPSSHLNYISKTIHTDAVKDWQLKWLNEQFYLASNVSTDSLHLLRQDPGVEEIEEGSWFEMDEVDRCQNPAFSEDETKQCYDAGPFDACKNEILSEDEMWICGRTP